MDARTVPIPSAILTTSTKVDQNNNIALSGSDDVLPTLSTIASLASLVSASPPSLSLPKTESLLKDIAPKLVGANSQYLMPYVASAFANSDKKEVVSLMKKAQSTKKPMFYDENEEKEFIEKRTKKIGQAFPKEWDADKKKRFLKYQKHQLYLEKKKKGVTTSKQYLEKQNMRSKERYRKRASDPTLYNEMRAQQRIYERNAKARKSIVKKMEQPVENALDDAVTTTTTTTITTITTTTTVNATPASIPNSTSILTSTSTSTLIPNLNDVPSLPNTSTMLLPSTYTRMVPISFLGHVFNSP